MGSATPDEDGAADGEFVDDVVGEEPPVHAASMSNSDASATLTIVLLSGGMATLRGRREIGDISLASSRPASRSAVVRR
jgi:hypothetical protein